jgi:very-short-patch-repair endonuclease
MIMKTYSSRLLPYARSMRKQMTSAEMRIWLHCLRTSPYKFRRQRPVGMYIADFYSADLKLVIEVDGGGHFESAAIQYDRDRTAFLESHGLRFLRFTNDEVLRHLEAVKLKLAAAFKPIASAHGQ